MNDSELKQAFIKLMSQYSNDKFFIENNWQNIENHYSAPKRFYHNLKHLSNMMVKFESVKAKIQYPDTVLFSLYYHDIIYNPSKKDNEEKSAMFLKLILEKTSFLQTEACVKQIEASKRHLNSDDEDINLFLDIDMSILGSKRDIYTEYTKQVRKEYSIYPDFLYNKGRKKVLKSFLEQDRIFKSEFFYKKYEKQARENIVGELYQFL